MQEFHNDVFYKNKMQFIGVQFESNNKEKRLNYNDRFRFSIFYCWKSFSKTYQSGQTRKSWIWWILLKGIDDLCRIDNNFAISQNHATWIMFLSQEFLINRLKLGREISKTKMYFVYTWSFSNKVWFQVFILDITLMQCYLSSGDNPGTYPKTSQVSKSAILC